MNKVWSFGQPFVWSGATVLRLGGKQLRRASKNRLAALGALVREPNNLAEFFDPDVEPHFLVAAAPVREAKLLPRDDVPGKVRPDNAGRGGVQKGTVDETFRRGRWMPVDRVAIAGELDETIQVLLAERSAQRDYLAGGEASCAEQSFELEQLHDLRGEPWPSWRFFGWFRFAAIEGLTGNGPRGGLLLCRVEPTW